MRPNRGSLTLPCVLTEEEIRIYGMQLAEELPKKKLLENELKKFKDQVNADISEISARVDELTNRINLKKEFRLIECAIKYDFPKNQKIWIRLDTGEIAKTTTIPTEDLQEDLPLPETLTDEETFGKF